VVDRLTNSTGFGLVHRLGHHGAVRPAGVAVCERSDLALATVMARRGAETALAAKVRDTFSLNLPMTPHRSASANIAFVWAGPGHWLATAEGETGHRFEARLRAALAGLASISDQSDGRAVLRIAGPRARDTFAKGLPVDLDPAVMQPGAAVVSAIAHIGVHLWQIDVSPTYECAVARSYALPFWSWLEASAAEFGLTVAPE
jgi:heterotetrameric sarcosine oxidase gamma subunit